MIQPIGINLLETDAVPLGSLAEWVSAAATSLGVIVAAVALGAVFIQVRQTAKQMRETARREAQDSEDRTRPYLSADVVTGLGGAPSFDLVVMNHGVSAARNVHIRIDGNDLAARSDDDQIAPALSRLFAAGFDLAPGARRRVFFRVPADPSADPPGEMGAPERGELVMTYQWRSGAGSRAHRSYEDRFCYDLEVYAPLIPSPATGPTSSGPESSLKNIAHAIRAVAEQVGEQRR